jgi:hypothetical protein
LSTDKEEKQMTSVCVFDEFAKVEAFMRGIPASKVEGVRIFSASPPKKKRRFLSNDPLYSTFIAIEMSLDVVVEVKRKWLWPLRYRSRIFDGVIVGNKGVQVLRDSAAAIIKPIADIAVKQFGGEKIHASI